MKYSINIPNFGDFADPRAVARVAVAAEQAGWDGLFVWDHVVHNKQKRRGVPFGDPWILLTAATLATERIRLGTLVTPVPRRRPENLARQVATLEHLSGGRIVFGAGLGGPLPDEYGDFGDTTDPTVLAERLDEGLDLLARYWTGERVTFDGAHFRARDTALLPATVQQPRPPIWIAGYWPNKRPMRRAARWDGVAPLFTSATHGAIADPAEVRAMLDYIRSRRDNPDAAFDVVLGGRTRAQDAAEIVGELEQAGATWWDERQLPDTAELTSEAAVRSRIDQGPPAAV